MRFFHSRYLTVLLAWWALGVAATTNNLTDVVSWDKYSLSINGERWVSCHASCTLCPWISG